MTLPMLIALDVAAILALTFGLYFPRHRRRDMVVAYLVVNVGLVAVTAALSATAVSLALGFGLFAVLSIIRLRSAELDQPEIAYYFAALTLGLLGGLVMTPDWLGPALMIGVLAALFVGDHPRLFARYRVQTVTLDAAHTDEEELIRRLETLLAARVHRIKVRRVDLVEATTTVEVRYSLPPASAPATLRNVTPAPDGVR
jgi:uncharacterized protein DUF4956